MERSVKLHPLLILFGIFAGGELAGISGIFLSVPALALLRLAFYEWRKSRFEAPHLHVNVTTVLSDSLVQQIPR
jgi:predicted PurR-regulated permease PerM